MELCRRTIEFVQVINEEGEVRICGWLKDGGIIGRLTDNTMEEIYHSTIQFAVSKDTGHLVLVFDRSAEPDMGQAAGLCCIEMSVKQLTALL